MALKPRKTRKRNIELDESLENFFLTGKAERGTAGWNLRLSRFFDGGEKIRLAWLQSRKFLLRKWKSEGRGLSWAEESFKQ